MYDLQEAVGAAREFARKMFPTEFPTMRVEEVEYKDDPAEWLITLGWPESDVRQLSSMLGSNQTTVVASPRVYKIFTVDANHGEVTSMKVRKI